jgi:hypothetical protein
MVPSRCQSRRKSARQSPMGLAAALAGGTSRDTFPTTRFSNAGEA